MFRLRDVRQETCRLLEMIDNGLLDPEDVVRMCVSYMSEDEVADMMRINDILEDEECEDENN